jgi:signal transduction histidine kinase
LANVVDGWGQVMLLRNYRMDDGTLSLRVERNYEAEFGEERPQTVSEWPELSGNFVHDHPLIRFDLYHEVIASRQMRVLLDAQQLPAEQLRGIAWPDARSLLCVPLVQPRTTEDDLEVFGLLVVASRRATRFNDNDLSIVSRLARSLVIGYRNLGLANAQKDILEQLTHDLSKAMVPLLHRVEDLTETAQRLESVVLTRDSAAVQAQLRQTNEQIAAVRGLANLSRDLILWSIDLSDKELVVADEPIEPLFVRMLVDQLQPGMAVLAQVLSGTEVRWELPDQQWLAVPSSFTRAKLIKATLFKYIENALKYGEGIVRVAISEVAGWVGFAVHSKSPVIPPSERASIFEMGFRGSNVNPNLPGSGTGLYQAQRTAEILGGRVAYRAEGDDDNVFIFELPSIAGPTVRKEARV